MPAIISPETSVKVVGGHGMSMSHVLAMDLDDHLMDGDLWYRTIRVPGGIMGDTPTSGDRLVLS